RRIADVDAEGESPYLERMICAWEDGRSAYLVTPHHAGGDLLRYIKEAGAVGYALLRTWAAEIACGLVSLQDLGIVHGAVRPSAVMIRAGGHIVLGGFENASHLTNVSTAVSDRGISKEWYHAPELLLGWEVGLEVDWWGYGIVLAWMACGQV
ncbi:kinase-like domain-containing protein, partial [Vararia minispora EC-137]